MSLDGKDGEEFAVEDDSNTLGPRVPGTLSSTQMQPNHLDGGVSTCITEPSLLSWAPQALSIASQRPRRIKPAGLQNWYLALMCAFPSGCERSQDRRRALSDVHIFCQSIIRSFKLGYTLLYMIFLKNDERHST